jgi:hypothetical protein
LIASILPWNSALHMSSSELWVSRQLSLILYSSYLFKYLIISFFS